MKRFLTALAICATAAIGSAAYAANANAPVVVMPGHEHWGKPDMGASTAVLYGNPDAGGFYVVRLKTGANWKFPPHFHPGRESVTVVSGTFYAGIGSKWDDKKLTAFPAGSFISLPPKMPHFAMTKEPAVIEIAGTDKFADVMIKK